MIDVVSFLKDIYTPLKSYSNTEQLVLGNQKIPPSKLQDDRIVYNAILYSDTGGRHTVIREDATVESDSDTFDYDVEETNTSFPEMTLSFTGYNNTRNATGKIREWFYTSELGGWWFKDNDYDCVIREVMEINDRTTYLEADYENRFGFDVRLEFKDEVKVTHATIEQIKITGDIEKTIDV